MDWKKFRQMIKECRHLSNWMVRQYKYETMFWFEPQVSFGDNLIFQLNPFCCNLKTGEYRIVARNLMTGRYHRVPNLKTCSLIE